MRVEVLIWLIANTISFVVSLHDLRITMRVWRWARNNVKAGEMHLVAKRNYRASLFRFALATSFVAGGLVAVLPVTTGAVWFLVAGAVILTTDIILEARYRGRMFSAAQRRAEQEHYEVKEKRKKSRKDCQ